MNFAFGSQAAAMGIHTVNAYPGRPQWMLVTSSVLFAVSIAGLISTWKVRVEYDARGATFRWGRLGWRHLPWTSVVKIVPANLSSGGLDLRTDEGDKTLSVAPNEEQLAKLQQWLRGAHESEPAPRIDLV
ncbi:MAG: hypothetical protein WA880_12875 [Ornithinimicrobium sp.]